MVPQICIRIVYILEFVFLRNDIGMVSEWYRVVFFRKTFNDLFTKNIFVTVGRGEIRQMCDMVLLFLGVDGVGLNGLPI